MVQHLHPYMTTGKTIALTLQTFVGKVIALLVSMLSRFVIAFLPGSKCLLISQGHCFALGTGPSSVSASGLRHHPSPNNSHLPLKGPCGFPSAHGALGPSVASAPGEDSSEIQPGVTSP